MMYVGGYHEYRGGYHPLKFEYRGGYHDTCGGDIMSTVGYSNKRFPPTVLMISPHGTEYPPRYSR